MKSKTTEVNGLKTYYLEAGKADGYPMVMLHSGEFGGCAEGSWKDLIPPLVEAGFHIYAPDWLGFGQSDKIVDFANPKGRRIDHMSGFIQSLRLDRAPVLVGNSMGGTYLLQELGKRNPEFRAAAAIVASGGGFVPNNAARQAIQDYDLTKKRLREIFGVLLHDPGWAEDEEFINWRHELTLVPGAWECAASARLVPPDVNRGGGEFGKEDTTRYEEIECPTLLIAGAQDPLRLPGYAEEIAERIPTSRVRTYDQCGHMPNIEHPDRFVVDVIEFCQSMLPEGKQLMNGSVAQG